MTSPSGDYPPPSEEDDQTPQPAHEAGGEPTSQANLWSEEESDSARDAHSVTAGRPDEVWSRRRPDVEEASASTANNAGQTEPVTAVDDADTPPLVASTSESDVEPEVVTEDSEDELFYPEQPQGSSAPVRARRVAWELIQTLVLAALIFLMVRGVAQNFRVEGPSMQPGLHNGEYLLVNKAVYFKLDLNKLGKYLPFVDGGDDPSRFLFHGPQRGDVIVFRYPRDPSRDFIKRIIGVPGDTVSIANGVVTVNGEVLAEPYAAPGSNSDMEPKVVPEDSYFVMGDNRPNSSDSRNWGFVPEENIIGKAMFAYWPMSDFGGVGNRSIDLGFIKVPFF